MEGVGHVDGVAQPHGVVARHLVGAGAVHGRHEPRGQSLDAKRLPFAQQRSDPPDTCGIERIGDEGSEFGVMTEGSRTDVGHGGTLPPAAPRPHSVIVSFVARQVFSVRIRTK